MTDTRPVMTDAEFEQRAAYVDANWWMTGESLIHVSSVMNVDGWRVYGHPGHMSLTPAQRTLMMWSDIVGQVSNGGFIQLCDNFARDLDRAVAAIDALQWPELRERFRRAMAEQAGDADSPRRVQPVPLSEDPEKWAASRRRIIRHLAGRGKAPGQPITPEDLAFVESQYDEWRLELEYQIAALRGALPSGGERMFDFVPPPEEEADAFDAWFFTDETKADSARYVHDFILRHRDQLYRTA
jgi:hypothetical protein